MIKTKDKEKLKFPGFPSNWGKSYWKCPRIMDEYWCYLSGSERAVLFFILRQTFGFGKKSDRLMTPQFRKGINEHNKGTGMSEKSIKRAIRGLEEKKFIWKRRISYWLNEYGPVMGSGIDDIRSKEMNMDKNTKDRDKSTKDLDKNTKDRDKNGTNTIENKNRKLEIEKEIEEIFFLYKKRICPEEEELDDEARKAIEERLQRFDSSKLEEAINRFTEDDWRMQRNRGLGIEWFFKSDDQVHTWLKLSPTHPEEKLRLGSYQKAMLTAPVRSDSTKPGFVYREKVNGKECIVHQPPSRAVHN
ncbi:MAG: replication protein [Candidatus Zambryskibacteria bacterium]